MQDNSSARSDSAQQRALGLLRSQGSFLIVGHRRPDGDCVGAQAALARVLGALGKQVTILNPDPVESKFDFLTRALRFDTFEGSLPEHDVSVLVDASELERCGELGSALQRSPSRKMVVDHHIHHGSTWWDEGFIDETASASGLLVYRIAKALDVPLDEIAVRGVFTSIATDTGWFRYSNTDSETLAIASELVARGLEPAVLFAAINQRREATHPAVVGRLLERVEYFAGGRLAVVDLPREEVASYDESSSDDVIGILRSVRSVEVVLFLRETSDGACVLSARSKSAYDVNQLARGFGGGGHLRASGATIPGSLAEVRRALIEATVTGLESTEPQKS